MEITSESQALDHLENYFKKNGVNEVSLLDVKTKESYVEVQCLKPYGLFIIDMTDGEIIDDYGVFSEPTDSYKGAFNLNKGGDMPTIKIPNKADDCGGRKKLISLKAELTLYATRGKRYVIEISHNRSLISEFKFSCNDETQLACWEDILECAFPRSSGGKEIIFHEWDDKPFENKLVKTTGN
jgi:hypothetical protein